MRLASLLVVLLALTAGAQSPRFRRFTQRTDQGRSTRGLPASQSVVFLFAPASGVGVPTSSGCYAANLVTGTKGEALTAGRASVAEVYSNDGQTLTQCAAGTARIATGSIASAWRGLLVDPASTNDVAFGRDLSNAAWVKTAMTCARTATGMRNDANGASTCTASGANGSVSYTVTTAAASRVGSLHIKRRTGTGTVSVSSDGATWTDITSSVSSSVWRRVVNWDAPGCAGGNCIVVPALATTAANPALAVRLGTSGDAVDVDFAQQEAGVRATTPIETLGTAQTRSADSYYFTVPSFRARALGASMQANGLNSAFTTVVGAWQDNLNTLVIWGGTGTIDQTFRCTNYTNATNETLGTVYLPATSATFTQMSCSVTDATSIVWTQRGVPASGVTTSSSLTTTRVYVGVTPLGGASVSGVVRGVCADSTPGACDATDFPAEGNAVVALGDSITLGSSQIPTRWVGQLNRALNRPVYNLGQTGESIDVCLSNYYSYVRGHGYSTITVLCGVNSLIAGDPASTVWPKLQTLLDAARADGLAVKVGTITPWGAYALSTAQKQTETTSLNSSIAAYCVANSATTKCVDFYASALNDGSGNLAVAYDSGDHIHPNAAGGALMATLWQAVFP